MRSGAVAEVRTGATQLGKFDVRPAPLVTGPSLILVTFTDNGARADGAVGELDLVNEAVDDDPPLVRAHPIPLIAVGS
jgi:hypothetical protein